MDQPTIPHGSIATPARAAKLSLSQLTRIETGLVSDISAASTWTGSPCGSFLYPESLVCSWYNYDESRPERSFPCRNNPRAPRRKTGNTFIPTLGLPEPLSTRLFSCVFVSLSLLPPYFVFLLPCRACWASSTPNSNWTVEFPRRTPHVSNIESEIPKT